MSYYWYYATAPSPFILADIACGNSKESAFGYTDVPDVEEIEKNDLRFIAYCSLDEVMDRYVKE